VSEEHAQVSEQQTDLWRVAAHGMRLCRQDKWEEGLEYLCHVADAAPEVELPTHFWAYLGYGLATCKARYREGLEHCRHAVELEFYEKESFLLLARTYLLLNSRGPAVEAINRGLQLDPGYGPLLDLERRVERRQQPVLSFLPRAHLVNRTLGRLRHRYRALRQHRVAGAAHSV
jgi:hypothetical protein